ncbi:hypothetical protein CH63R_05927 [Colletotrichum higginsianum IMI 349063]|uniref:Uncharacterized protein n=1 Tax=Colletotrichum higginsianum (strain IMI 349063) TaxID=759273 RepID=A0A1B7YDX7_COLHI|nr:hypothetical protein CH63R_05927 [Colletotrichum higginsianum IMI 349063]OBR10235.1 hypothetical protein CH63R_05927 [Colletotrichum higginsianum IMI 349063]
MKYLGQRSFDAAHPSTVRSPEVDGSPVRQEASKGSISVTRMLDVSKVHMWLLPYRMACTLPRPRPQERTADSGTNELIIHPVQEASSSNSPANSED